MAQQPFNTHCWFNASFPAQDVAIALDAVSIPVVVFNSKADQAKYKADRPCFFGINIEDESDINGEDIRQLAELINETLIDKTGFNITFCCPANLNRESKSAKQARLAANMQNQNPADNDEDEANPEDQDEAGGVENDGMGDPSHMNDVDANNGPVATSDGTTFQEIVNAFQALPLQHIPPEQLEKCLEMLAKNNQSQDPPIHTVTERTGNDANPTHRTTMMSLGNNAQQAAHSIINSHVHLNWGQTVSEVSQGLKTVVDMSGIDRLVTILKNIGTFSPMLATLLVDEINKDKPELARYFLESVKSDSSSFNTADQVVKSRMIEQLELYRRIEEKQFRTRMEKFMSTMDLSLAVIPVMQEQLATLVAAAGQSDGVKADSESVKRETHEEKSRLVDHEDHEMCDTEQDNNVNQSAPMQLTPPVSLPYGPTYTMPPLQTPETPNKVVFLTGTHTQLNTDGSTNHDILIKPMDAGFEPMSKHASNVMIMSSPHRTSGVPQSAPIIEDHENAF